MRNEYPRPQFERADWLCLNGTWQFAYDGSNNATIQVPFVYQSKLSGIHDTRVSNMVHYQRDFQVPSQWQGKQVMLHFGAVDYQCVITVNGQRAGEHTGGHTPFSMDITQWLTWQTETVTVDVFDPYDDEGVARGKQFWEKDPKFIWYTQSTGIWQSVWLEPVDAMRFENIRFTPDIDSGTVAVEYTLSHGCKLPCQAAFTIAQNGERVFEGQMIAGSRASKLTVDIFKNKVLKGPFHGGGLCWSPQSPTLFDVEATLTVNGAQTDSVRSYFGMRKVSVENGRFYLNNRPYYQKLVLDQGYWADGMLTAPSDQAFIEDIERCKAMGFNGCRKHEKVEDPRFLYWADRLGFLVWGGMPSFISYDAQAAAAFTQEWMQALARDYNHPSIVVWNMLNESWGVPGIYSDAAQQSFSRSLYHLAKSMDATRLVIGNDGWEQTETDICAIHSYSHGQEGDTAQQQRFANALKSLQGLSQDGVVLHPAFAKGFAHQGQPVMLTEFGGISCELALDGEGWGYTSVNSEENFLQTYGRLLKAIYDSPVICGFCYTQIADVQQEKNGLLDQYHQFKFDADAILKINNSNPKDPI